MRSGFSWLILVAALVVPAFLFWNWWSKMKLENSRTETKQSGSENSLAGVSSGISAEGQNFVQPATPIASVPISTTSSAAIPLERIEESTVSSPQNSISTRTLTELAYRTSKDRDPTLSPMDIKKLAQKKLEQETPKPPPVVEEATPPPGPEDKIILYGVVATPNGINALVNDRVLKEGDKIEGAVVQRITTNVVVFKYGNRTFIKKVR